MATISLEDGSFVREIKEHTDEWFRYARRLTGENARAEDLVQTALLKIHSRLKKAPLTVETAFTAYVHTCIRSAFCTWWDKQVREKTTLVSIQLLIEACDSNRKRELFGDRLVELIEVLNQYLTTRETTILVLHDVLGFTYLEIQRLTRISNARTLADWAAKARERLRQHEAELMPSLGAGESSSTWDGE